MHLSDVMEKMIEKFSVQERLVYNLNRNAAQSTQAGAKN